MKAFRDNYFLVKEVTDDRVIYGVLVTDDNITRQQVQDEINDIKKNMDDELASSYTIEDDIIPNLSFNCEIETIEDIYI